MTKSYNMKILPFLILSALQFHVKAETEEVLDNNQFLIYNKKYPFARLTQYKAKEKEVGTYEGGIYSDQLWTLTPHPYQEGCYYIENEFHPGWRIANYRHTFKVYEGPYFDDQLFKFVPFDDEYYYIYNCHYTNDRITKYGHDDKEVTMYSGNLHPDQLWKLVPRFTAGFRTHQLFHIDNRQSSVPITRKVSVTTGLTRTSSTTIRSQRTFKRSMEKSLSVAIKELEVGATNGREFTRELEKSFSKSSEASWSATVELEFTIPARTNYKVLQRYSIFHGVIGADSSTLWTNMKIFESKTDQFEGEDEYIINKG